MRDARTTTEARPPESASVPFPELNDALEAGGPVAALERLVEDLEEAKNYRLLLDALLLKARFELNLPLIQVGRYAEMPEDDRTRFEDRYIESLRRVGSLLLKSGDVAAAWAYFQAIGEPAPVAEALEAIEPPDDPEAIAPLIDVAFHQGANPRRGFEWILRYYGPCSAITSLEQLGPVDPAVRSDCVNKLVRHLHGQLVENLRADVARRGQPQPSEKATIADIVAGREWLFSDDSYHTDVSHLTTAVRWSIATTDPATLDLAIDLTEYGRRLSSRLMYDSASPFENTFEDHHIYLKALANRDVDQAIEHFRAKLKPLSDVVEEESTVPAQVLVNLLMRTGRQSEAIETAAERLLQTPESHLACPSLPELCQQTGRLDRLTEIAAQTGHPVHYLAARLQLKENGRNDEDRDG